MKASKIRSMVPHGENTIAGRVRWQFPVFSPSHAKASQTAHTGVTLKLVLAAFWPFSLMSTAAASAWAITNVLATVKMHGWEAGHDIFKGARPSALPSPFSWVPGIRWQNLHPLTRQCWKEQGRAAFSELLSSGASLTLAFFFEKGHLSNN